MTLVSVKTSTVFLLEQVINQLDEPTLRTEYKDIEKTSVAKRRRILLNASGVGLNIISPPTPTPKRRNQNE